MTKQKVLLYSAVALIIGAVILAGLSLNGNLFQGKLSNLNACNQESKICLGIKKAKNNIPKANIKSIKENYPNPDFYPDPSWYPDPDWQPKN